MSCRSRALRVLAFAFALICGACATGPTLELGDDLTDAYDGGAKDAGDARTDAAGDDSGSSELPSDGDVLETPDAFARDGGEAVECGSDNECEEGEAACAEGEDCGECVTDADCDDPEASFCAGSRCVECTRDEDCAGPEHTLCSLPEGHCE